MYHSIARVATRRFQRFVVAPERFAEHMAYLRAEGYRPLTVSQYRDALCGDSPIAIERAVVLTFDDGFADFHEHALPVLAQHRFPATLFIVTAFIGGKSCWLQTEGESERPMLTWRAISDVVAAGIECGSHSHSHPQLDLLPSVTAWDEITRCRSILEQGTGRPVRTFAYPYGYYTAQVRHLVRRAGYASACATKYRLSGPDDDLFGLARLLVPAGADDRELAALLTRARCFISAHHQWRSQVWQVLRIGRASLLRILSGKGAAR